ncbi:MAG: DNA polymerase III subunit delta [Patescibacteria group bacterium]|nr:DNA polymerase III subunit delta [Patescibacteria group bacterium]
MASLGVPFHALMINFIYGENNFLAQRKYQEYKSVFTLKNPGAPIDVFDCDENFDFQYIQRSLQSSYSLFSKKRCVILKNPFTLNVLNQKKIIELLEINSNSGNDNIIVVVELRTPKPKGRLLNFLKKGAKNEKLDALDQKRLKDWIIKELERQSDKKTTILPDALEYLIGITRGNMWTVNNEIKKLVNYQEKGSINKKDIEKLCHGKVESGIFELVDAIGNNNKARAIALKNNLLAQGENEFYIFSMIISQFRNLIKVGECVLKGVNDPNRISKLCTMHPFVVRKTLAQLRNYNKRQLKNIFSLASEIDLKTKTSDIEMSEALDYLIVKI